MVTSGHAARDDAHRRVVIRRTPRRGEGHAVSVSLCPFALSDAANPVFSTDFT